MKNHAVALACTIAAAAMVITACDKRVDGQPTPPAGTTTPGPSSSRAFSKAPAVSQPLDATKYIANPCKSLTPAQYQGFDAAPGAPTNGVESPNCMWPIAGGDTKLSVLYITKVPEGLSGIYAQKDAGIWDKGYFEPTTVASYPAVYAAIGDFRSRGDCELNVGVNDNLYFVSMVQSRAGDDSCAAAMNVAKAVIETVKKGA
jgi:hypothetical protein